MATGIKKGGQMKERNLFLVLCHTDGNHGTSRGTPIHHNQAKARSSCDAFGGNLMPHQSNHDALCHCLVVRRQTFKSREAADAKAKELQAQYPSDMYWSLGVESPD